MRKNDGVGQGMDALGVRWWLDAVLSPPPMNWISGLCSDDDVMGANDLVGGLKWPLKKIILQLLHVCAFL